MTNLEQSDPKVFAIIKREARRQKETLSMIPSENFFSPAVREAVGSVFMHKYTEGNIGRRYYEGCEIADALEELALERARQAFRLPGTWDANVQALSGSNANQAVYLALLQPGDTILSMYLPDGGHLSHGWSYEPSLPSPAEEPVYRGGSRKVNITSRLYRVVQYKTDPATQQFDYDQIEQIARQEKPKLLITGGTAYPRLIDHARMRAIADAVGAYYLADIAHEAGLIAAGVLPTPVGVADVVTLTTHKTLRAGRGAIILASRELIKKIDRAVLPGLQGGPHMHNIAGVCAGLGEAVTDEFRVYAQAVLDNTRELAQGLIEQGFRLVTGGGDKHLLLIDLRDQPLLGRPYARALAAAGIVANYNTMPQETRSPLDPSALRVGTPHSTGRGMRAAEMVQIAGWMREVMEAAASWQEMKFEAFDEAARQSPDLQRIAVAVRELCVRFPLPLSAFAVTEGVH